GEAEEDAIGVGLADGSGFGRALISLEANVATNHMDAFIHFAELPDPVVPKTPAHAPQDLPLGDAAGDGDQHDVLAAVIPPAELRVERIAFAVQREHAGNRRSIL